MRHERFGSAAPAARHGDNALPAGTAVLTLDGALPVEHLTPGDRIITRDAGAARLRMVRITRRRCAMVRISAGTLGPQSPGGDALLPAGARVLLRGDHALAATGRAWSLVTARQLQDGIRVCDGGLRHMPLFELIFDAPHILYAAGLELVSAAPVTAPSRQTPLAAPRAGLRR